MIFKVQIMQKMTPKLSAIWRNESIMFKTAAWIISIIGMLFLFVPGELSILNYHLKYLMLAIYAIGIGCFLRTMYIHVHDLLNNK